MNNQNLPIRSEIYKLAEDFLWNSADFYTDEATRLEAIEEPLEKIWGHFGESTFGKNYAASNGVLVTDVGNQVAYRMILECKNEIGTGGSDPTLQMSISYRGYWSQGDVCIH